MYGPALILPSSACILSGCIRLVALSARLSCASDDQCLIACELSHIAGYYDGLSLCRVGYSGGLYGRLRVSVIGCVAEKTLGRQCRPIAA